MFLKGYLYNFQGYNFRAGLMGQIGYHKKSYCNSLCLFFLQIHTYIFFRKFVPCSFVSVSVSGNTVRMYCLFICRHDIVFNINYFRNLCVVSNLEARCVVKKNQYAFLFRDLTAVGLVPFDIIFLVHSLLSIT